MRTILTSTLAAAFLVAAGAAQAQPSDTAEPAPEQTAPVQDEAQPSDSADPAHTDHRGDENKDGDESKDAGTTTTDEEPAQTDQTL